MNMLKAKFTQAAPTDNTFGAGNIPLPDKLKSLSRFADAFRTILDHKAFPAHGTEPEIHMLTVKADTRFSIMGADMRTLLKLGLVRMQVNNPGTMDIYFSV